MFRLRRYNYFLKKQSFFLLFNKLRTYFDTLGLVDNTVRFVRESLHGPHDKQIFQRFLIAITLTLVSVSGALTVSQNAKNCQSERQKLLVRTPLTDFKWSSIRLLIASLLVFIYHSCSRLIIIFGKIFYFSCEILYISCHVITTAFANVSFHVRPRHCH